MKMTTDSKDLLFRAGHRDRLREKFLNDHLTDTELLELVLADIIPRRDVRPLSRALIAEFGNLSQVLSATFDKLMSVKGVGRNTAIHLKLINKIMGQGYKQFLKDVPVFHEHGILLNYLLSILADKTVEELHVLYLGTNYKLLADEVNSVGTIDWTPIFEREIIKRALNLNSMFIILAHNHPATPEPFSTDDILATEKLEAMLNTVGIKLYDHYVVANGIVYSARESFALKTRVAPASDAVSMQNNLSEKTNCV